MLSSCPSFIQTQIQQWPVIAYSDFSAVVLTENIWYVEREVSYTYFPALSTSWMFLLQVSSSSDWPILLFLSAVIGLFVSCDYFELVFLVFENHLK